ncbi:MAG: CDP-2,3-bis-(O-geranylgeranyl)-sn-glycerol synthase [Thermoplasmata archaeon]
MEIPLILAQAFWFMIPAYVANPTAVLFGGGTPMDFGLKFRDGRRILGDGKTWRGFTGGIFSGMLVGGIQHLSASLAGVWKFLFGSPLQAALLLFLLPCGALLGDILGSFIKRRAGIERGAKTPGLDQYDFLIGTILLLLIFQTAWFLKYYVLDYSFVGLIFIIFITPLLHRVVNILGYKLGKKDVPW